MKFFFLTGEVSGDLLAAKLIKELKEKDKQLEIFGTGGEHMEQEGVSLVLHHQKMAFMGFYEVLKNIFQIRRNFRIVRKSILDIQPDVIVLVDYPGFNLRMAEWAKKNNFKVVYYVAPKVWAWKERRVKKLQAYVDLLLVLFPFEEEYFQRFSIPTKFVGHPLGYELKVQQKFQQNRIALLPGSRKQEIDRMLPVMLDAFQQQSDKKLIVAGLSVLGESYYQSIIQGRAELQLDETQQVLEQAELAVVTSGTASLETALKGVPQVVCYAMHPITYWIAKRLIQIKYISLVNLILQAAIVPELIQQQFNTESLWETSNTVLKHRKEVEKDYLRLRKAIGSENASEKAARELLLFAQNKMGD